ncbi:MAG: TIGR03960 family B12-binding radical SAM protein [Desulfovibrio sp.]
MKELLPILPKPSRYSGGEWGAVVKDPAQVKVRLALAFPDMYEVGMSYMGHKVLSAAVNQHDHLWAERVYTPCEETAEIMRERNVLLATLESDTPLKQLDAVGISLTHELCYTNVLYMLDLSGIALLTKDREENDPFILGGGGACFNAEPVSDYFDVMTIGDGEESMVAILNTIGEGREKRLSRKEILAEISKIPGMYVPSFFEYQGPNLPLKPLREGYETVEKAIVKDLSTAPFPTQQVQSYGNAVHDRMTLEIARGCTRGCRFCQAGMIYRPVRERTPEELEEILRQSIEETGYEDVSFLSLSTGDYSALEDLFSRSYDRCAAEQVSISLPSLRVGSISAPIMERMAKIRRTGATLAPEAGSQRLRDVINKGVDEEGLLLHIRKLFDNGWQNVKLYFMIGLPTETQEDLDAIIDLCAKVRDVAGKHIKRIQVTASVSPFVPKPQTPFQWERQLSKEEIIERIIYLKDQAKKQKRVNIKFHMPEMTALEGVFSRGDRRLNDVVMKAYRKGALFSSWKDHLKLDPYLEALEECGLTMEGYQAARDVDGPLPWDHLDAGLHKSFLQKELERAIGEKITKDCRYHACRNCGVCNHDKQVSRLEKQSCGEPIGPKMVYTTRDQSTEEEYIPVEPKKVVEKPPRPPRSHLNDKAAHFRMWFTKSGPSAYLSQLELQSVFERALRRARLPLSFSEGYHPLPRISFGMALPVGVESRCEWFNLYLWEDVSRDDIVERLKNNFAEGIEIFRVDRLSLGKKQPQPVEDEFTLTFVGGGEENLLKLWEGFMKQKEFIFERKTKKGMREVNLRKFIKSTTPMGTKALQIIFDWREGYINPMTLVEAICGGIEKADYKLMKISQRF